VLNATTRPARGRPAGRGRREWFSPRPVRPDRLAACGHPWQHNLENALAARWPREAVGVSAPTATARSARSRHRRTGWRWWRLATASFVERLQGDQPEAAMMALTAFDDGIRLILGGS
jgi:hypothetical protein